MLKLNERLRHIVEAETDKTKRWKTLEKLSGIPAPNWAAAVSGKQRPTSEMIECVGKTWPKYAFYLVTGITDTMAGHVAPESVQTWPERNLPSSDETNDYFEKQIELANDLFSKTKIDPTNSEHISMAYQKTKIGANWHSAPITALAYKMSSSPEYEELKELSKSRVQELLTKSELLNENAKTEKNCNSSRDEISSWLVEDKISKHQSIWEQFYTPNKTE